MSRKTVIDGRTFIVDSSRDCPFFAPDSDRSDEECRYPTEYKHKVLTYASMCRSPYDSKCPLPKEGA